MLSSPNNNNNAKQNKIEQELPGVYVYSIEIGGNIVADEIEGFFSNVNKQVDFVCEYVKNDPNLQGGFNAIGFSQGRLTRYT